MTWLLQTTLEILWLLIPASVANMAPVIAAKYQWTPLLDKPIDNGKTFNNKAIFGDHKTYRGFFFGGILAGLTGLIQYTIQPNPGIQNILLLEFTSPATAFILAALIGFAALVGDALKSFLKRQVANIPSGKPWRPYDQIDYVAGALVVATVVAPVTIAHTIIALIILGLGSYITSAIGVALHIKKSL